jgi:hypothetical protein
LGVETPGSAMTPRLLNGGAIRQHPSETTPQGSADALGSKPLIQEMAEPRGRVANAFEDSHIRHIGSATPARPGCRASQRPIVPGVGEDKPKEGFRGLNRPHRGHRPKRPGGILPSFGEKMEHNRPLLVSGLLRRGLIGVLMHLHIRSSP